MKKDKSKIEMYAHCKGCMSGQHAFGQTKKGFQVFCETCNKSVLEIDLMGQKVKLK